MGESEGGVSTNSVRAAVQRDLQLTNQEQVLRCGGKRKVESEVLNCKKRRENTDFGVHRQTKPSINIVIS